MESKNKHVVFKHFFDNKCDSCVGQSCQIPQTAQKLGTALKRSGDAIATVYLAVQLLPDLQTDGKVAHTQLLSSWTLVNHLSRASFERKKLHNTMI